MEMNRFLADWFRLECDRFRFDWKPFMWDCMKYMNDHQLFGLFSSRVCIFFVFFAKFAECGDGKWMGLY
jgi:hypothetical protein